MVKFPLVLLLFEVVVGWPKGGDYYAGRDAPYTSIHPDWRSNGSGGSGYDRNQHHPNDDHYHAAQPNNSASNYMDMYNQYAHPRSFQEMPPFLGQPPYPVPQPFPPYPPQSGNPMLTPMQQPPMQQPHQFPMYPNKQQWEHKEERPPQRQMPRDPPSQKNKKPDVEHAQHPPFNSNFVGHDQDMNLRGAPSHENSFPTPPPMYPGQVDQQYPHVNQRPLVPPIEQSLPFRNEPFQPKESFNMIPDLPLAMMERPGVIDLIEPVVPRFLPKRHAQAENDKKHDLDKREDISGNESPADRYEKKTDPSWHSNQGLPSPNERRFESSMNQYGGGSGDGTKHSQQSEKNANSGVFAPMSGKGVQFVTSAPYNQLQGYQNPPLPVPLQDDPMVTADLPPRYESHYGPPSNKQLILFHELLRKLEKAQQAGQLFQPPIPNAPHFSSRPSPNETPQKYQEPPVQTHPTREFNPEVTNTTESVHKSNRQDPNPTPIPKYYMPDVPQMPPVKPADYGRTFQAPYNKVIEPSVPTNYDLDPRKYFSGPNYVVPPLNEGAERYTPLRPYEPPNRLYPSPSPVEPPVSDPYYEVRPMIMGRPDMPPYDAVMKHPHPFDPTRKYPEGQEGPYLNEMKNGSSRALRKARDTAKMKSSADGEEEDKTENNVASGVFRRYFGLAPIEHQERYSYPSTNVSFKFKSTAPHFLPTPVPPVANSEVEYRNPFQPYMWGGHNPLRPEVIHLLADNKYIRRRLMRPHPRMPVVPCNIHTPIHLYSLGNRRENSIEEFPKIIPLAPSPFIKVRAINYIPRSNSFWEDRRKVFSRYNQNIPSYDEDMNQEESVKHSFELNRKKRIYERLLSEIFGRMGFKVKPIYSVKRFERLNSNPRPYRTIPLDDTMSPQELSNIRIFVRPKEQEKPRMRIIELSPSRDIETNEKFFPKFGPIVPDAVKLRLIRLGSPESQSREDEIANIGEEHPHHLRGKIRLIIHPIKQEFDQRNHNGNLRLFRIPLSNDYERKVRTRMNFDSLMAEVLRKIGLGNKPYVVRKISREGPADVLTNVIETATNDEERIPFDFHSKAEDPLLSDGQFFVPRKPRHLVEYPLETLTEPKDRDFFETAGRPRSENPTIRVRIIRLLKEPENEPGKLFQKLSTKFSAGSSEPTVPEQLSTDDLNIRKLRQNLFNLEDDTKQSQNSLLPEIIDPKIIGSDKSSSFYRSVRYESGPGNTVTKIVEAISPDGEREKSVYQIPRSKLHDEPDFVGPFSRPFGISNILSDFFKTFGSFHTKAHVENERDNLISNEIKSKPENGESTDVSDSADKQDELNSSFVGNIFSDLIKKFRSPKDHFFSRIVRLEKGPGDGFTKITETTTSDGQKTVLRESVYDNHNGSDSLLTNKADESEEPRGVLRNLGLNLWPFSGNDSGEKADKPEIHRFKFIITPNLQAKLIKIKPHIFLSRKGPTAEPPTADEEAEIPPIPFDTLPVPPSTTTPMPDSLLDVEGTETESPIINDHPKSDVPTVLGAEGLGTDTSQLEAKSENSKARLRFYWKILDALSSALCPSYMIRPRTFITETIDKIRNKV